MWYFIGGFAFGILFGILFFIAYGKKFKSVGELVVDRSDEDGPFLFLQLHESLSRVEEKNEVTLTVVHKNYIPQK